jgi:hypothetical protein
MPRTVSWRVVAAACGRQILVTVSRELIPELGTGYSHAALARMSRFAEWMTVDPILASLSQELGWSHPEGRQ